MAGSPIGTPILRCQASDGLGHSLLGYHDGIDSWTVNVAHDPKGEHQSFVSHHEAAHHRLHSATPWGLATLVAGVPDNEEVVAAERWIELLDGCRMTHEVYATWAAAERTPEVDELLFNNLLYASYLREARFLASVISDSLVVASRGVDLLVRLVMSPAFLRETDIEDLRSPALEFAERDLPDNRLRYLIDRFDGSAVQNAVREALAVPSDTPLALDGIFEELDLLGVPTMTLEDQRDWTDRIVAQLDREHPGRFVSVRADSRGDFTEALDDQQRERIQMHGAPLDLEVIRPDSQGKFRVETFVRSAEEIGKHVWLGWLHPGFLKRQFATEEELGGEPLLGLLSCDRVHGDPQAFWFPFPSVPPSMAAHSMRAGDTTPILFTTLRTLDATDGSVDFRGFEPAFVLIDSDLVAFLQRSLEGEAFRWSMIGSAGSRTIDVLIFEQADVPGIYYLCVCSAPTSRLVAAWLASRETPQMQDSAPFVGVRPMVWALIEHLLGTFWIFDLHGFDPDSRGGVRSS